MINKIAAHEDLERYYHSFTLAMVPNRAKHFKPLLLDIFVRCSDLFSIFRLTCIKKQPFVGLL